MFSKFTRIGAEPVKWQFTLHITKLSLPSLKSACVVVSRGDSKVSTSYTEPVKGYFSFPEPLTLICTLYRKRDKANSDKGGNGVYLPKEGEVRIMEKGKAKEAGVVAIDFSEYVSESRGGVESLDNNWRIEKTADKYNNFMIVNITAKRLGSGGAAEDGGGAAEVTARKEEFKEAEEDDGENEAEREEREWKKRNALPASKGKQRDAKQRKWKDEEEEDEEADGVEDEDDEPLEDEDDDSPKKKPAPAATAKSKQSKPAAAHIDDDEEQWSEAEDDIIKRLKGLKAEGKLAPVSKPAATAGKSGAKVEEKKGAAAAKGKPAGAKKDRSQMTAKELLFAESSDEEEEKVGEEPEEDEVKPKRGAAVKATAGKDKEKDDKARGGSKAASNATSARPAKSLNWEIVIPTASSSPHAVTSSAPSIASAATSATPPAKPIPANRLFSCTLAEANTVYPSSIKSPPAVPYILTFLLQQLEKANAFLTPSLFKQYVDPSQITALRTQLEQGNWKLKGAHSDDPHALGGVLKLWVSGLQDGLVGETLVADALQVGMMQGEEDDDVAAALKRVSARLSPLHRASFVALLQFLQTMTLPLNMRKNGMKAESLASAWGSAIVRMKADPKKSAYDQFSDKANVNRFVQYSMQHLEAVKAATGAGAGPAGGASGGKAVVAARQVEEEGEEGGEEGEEVLKEDEDEEGEEAVQDESDGEVAGLKFHHDHGEDEEDEKPKGKGKALTARERLEQEKQEREKQKAEKERAEKAEKAKVEREKAEKERAEKEKSDKLKAEKDKLDRDKKEKEEKDRREKERKDKEERDRKEREERERKEKEKLAGGKKVGAAAAAFKPANVFGDSDLDDDEAEGEEAHDEEDEHHEEDDEAVDDDEEEFKIIQPKGARPTSPPANAASTINAGTSSKVDRELIFRLQSELEAVRKQLTESQSKQSSSAKATSSSAQDVHELKTKLVTALKEKDAALKEKREADKKLTALETERESQKKMIEKLQKMLVAKGKIDATQLSELNDSSKSRASPAAPPPPPPAGGVGAGKLSEHLSVMQLKYDAVVEDMEQKLANEKQIRKQLKQQLEQLTEENSNLRQRSMHFDQLVQTSLSPSTATSPSVASQGSKKTKDELLNIVAQQYERISFLEHTMRENEAMMRQAKQAWTDSARIMEDEMAHKDDELKRMKEGYEAATQDKGVEWVGEEEWRKRVERLKREKERCEREKKEMDDEVRGKRVELQEAMKTILQLEDDTRLLKEELTRTGIALKTIAEDNFELKEWMRLHSKGKKG